MAAAGLGWWGLLHVLRAGHQAERRGDPLPPPDPRPPCWRLVPRPPYDWADDTSH